MFKLLCFSLSLVATNSLASRNPSKEIYNLHYLFKKFEYFQNYVEVKGAYTKHRGWMVHPKGDSFQISKDEFERERSLGRSVLTAKRKEASGFSEEDVYDGTAFVVGDDYILTNFHVYSREFRQNASCAGFSVSTDFGDKRTFKCDKKIKCNKPLDYCLIRVKKSSKRVEVEIRGKLRKRNRDFSISYFVPALALYPKEFSISDNESHLLAIGNAGGYGIQASQGKGVSPIGKRTKVADKKVFSEVLHHATIVPGNSGGPLIDDQDRVIAINTQEALKAKVKIRNNGKRIEKRDGYNVADNAYNRSSTIWAILKDLESDEEIKKEVLPFLNIR